MGFRERPEYQDWRAAVFRLFGRKCIRCGHDGNIHAHHVMPVNEYPELAFEPTNGVPLCGNCHTEIKGNELAHADDLKRRQREIQGIATSAVTDNAPSESELRERAFADPSNVQAVEAWFGKSTDSQAVVDFYGRFRAHLPKTAMLCCSVVRHLQILERWNDLIETIDQAICCTEQEGVPEKYIRNLRLLKARIVCALRPIPEAVAFVREQASCFPGSAELHYGLSEALHEAFSPRKHDQENSDVLEECLRHAVRAAELSPNKLEYVLWASQLFAKKAEDVVPCDGVLRSGDDPILKAQRRCYASAIRYAKRVLEVAATDPEKMSALVRLAKLLVECELYAEARSYLRQALQIDDCNVTVIRNIANCYSMEGNCREASKMARRGLVFDPDDRICQMLRDTHGGFSVWQW